jgi:hypothetical protein
MCCETRCTTKSRCESAFRRIGWIRFLPVFIFGLRCKMKKNGAAGVARAGGAAGAGHLPRTGRTAWRGRDRRKNWGSGAGQNQRGDRGCRNKRDLQNDRAHRIERVQRVQRVQRVRRIGRAGRVNRDQSVRWDRSPCPNRRHRDGARDAYRSGSAISCGCGPGCPAVRS